MRNFYVAALLAVTACGPSVKDPALDLMTIEVEPANATLTYTGTPLTLDYTAIGHYADGHTAPIADAVFALDGDGALLGNLTAAQFEATGAAAGKGGVLAQVGAITGGTSVAVIVHPVHLGPGVPANGADNFPDNPPGGATAPTVVYPLESAVMPASVKSPDAQWEGANAAGDLYRVRITAGQFATVDSILAAGPTFKLDNQVSDLDWRMLVKSANNGPITFEIAHWNQATSVAAAPLRTVHIVNADVTGAIYYWNLGQGQMERSDAAGRAPAIKNPPMQPSTGSRCVACHTVSKDGRYLSGSLWGGGLQGGVFDMSDPAVQTSDPAPTLAPVTENTTYTQLFSTFNQDASRLMINVGTGFALIDPRNGAAVPTTGTPLPTANASHPAWSPDGSTVAMINNISLGGQASGWAIDYDRGDLQVFTAGPGDSFGAPTNLVPAAQVDPAFAAPSWPTFSPDSQWIAYGAGINSRCAAGTTSYPGSLFLVNKIGGATVRLDTACGGARLCYLPNFSPYDAGGYYWLVFYSFRDYGNALAGTKGAVRRQMWITAIDKSKLGTGGVDASSVSYWVPDQDVQTANMSAFWAVPPPIQ
ncbi:hypothetical protein BH11MYX3_BH11MYX3_13140 [soil metagenome]